MLAAATTLTQVLLSAARVLRWVQASLFPQRGGSVAWRGLAAGAVPPVGVAVAGVGIPDCLPEFRGWAVSGADLFGFGHLYRAGAGVRWRLMLLGGFGAG